ncbi:MAG: PPC domain-containing protein [Pirellulales bacterium]
MKYRFLIVAAATVACWLSASAVLAQKAPEVGFVWPPSVPVGAATDVHFGGCDWTPDMQFFVSDPRVTLEILGPPGEIILPPPPYWFGPKSTQVQLPLVRQIPIRITVPADMPAGPVWWQVANANGGSPHGVFYVGNLPHQTEQERSRQPLALGPLPATVCGRLVKIEDLDRYRFRAEQAGLITLELFARRLNSAFYALIEVHDVAGGKIADVADTQGLDAALTFGVEAGHEYEIRVFDVDFRGDTSFVYRLDVRAGPRIISARPAGGKRGETREVAFSGIGLATGAPQLETITRPVTFPADHAGNSFVHAVETPFGTARHMLALGDLPEQLKPADAAVYAIAEPAAINGVLQERGQPDVYQLTLAKDEMWTFEAEARRFGLPLDLSLAIVGPDDKELLRVDDPAPGMADPTLSFTAPADGVYRLLVGDSSNRAGVVTAVYRLVAQKAAPGFTLRTVELLNITVGGKAELQVSVTRHGGFQEPIALAVSGLPEGVTATGDLIIPADKPELKIPLESAADAPSGATLATVSGTAAIAGQMVTQPALAPASGNLVPRSAENNLLPTVLVSSVMAKRCRISPVDKDGGRAMNRGSTFPAEVNVERLEGYTGEVLIQLAGRQSYQQQGSTGIDTVVPPGVTRMAYPCYLPEWMEISRTSRIIAIGVTKVPDSRGNVRWLVSPMEGRITFLLEGALLKLSHELGETAITAGQSIEVPLKVARSIKLPNTAQLELLVPEELQGLVSAEQVTSLGDQANVVMKIDTVADPRLLGTHALTIRATAMQQGYLPVISETTVEFDVEESTAADSP